MLPRNTFGELSRNARLKNRYIILYPLGKGGMGRVYEAMDENLACIVAVKEMRLDPGNLPEGLSDDERQERMQTLRDSFAREGKLLANLRHPALPLVSDFFTEDDGQFLVMEHITGTTLAELLKIPNRPIPYEIVMQWADELLDALEYLHKNSIIHRDIKPANVKLTEKNEIFLLDFGLAKGAAGQMPWLSAGKAVSVPGATEAYAPLEQLNGSGTDPRSDLYSLGATLYHLLTAQVPISSRQRNRQIERDQPDPLLPAREANPAVPDHLSQLISKVMAIARNDRFMSSTAMRQALAAAARDIEEERLNPTPRPRPIVNEVVELEKWPSEISDDVKAPAETAVNFDSLSHVEAPAPAPLAQPREELPAPEAEMKAGLRGAEDLKDEATRSPVKGAGAMPVNAPTALPPPDVSAKGGREVAAEPRLARLKQSLGDRFSSIRRRWLRTRRQRQVFVAILAVLLIAALIWIVRSLLKSGDTPTVPPGTSIAGSNGNGKGNTSNANGTKDVDPGTLPSSKPVRPPRFASSQPNLSKQHGDVWSIAFSPDGGMVASAGKDRQVKLWRAPSWKYHGRLNRHRKGVTSIAFSNKGRTLASGSNDGTVKLWDAEKASFLSELPGQFREVKSVAFSPDGTKVAAVGMDKRVIVWDVSNHAAPKVLWEHNSDLLSIAFSPDSETLAGAGKLINIWNAQDGTQAQPPLTGHSQQIKSIAFSPDGKLLAIDNEDKSIKLLKLNAARKWEEYKTLLGHNADVTALAFWPQTPDGEILASASKDKTIKLWNTRDAKVFQTLTDHSDMIYSIAFSPDGRTLISGSKDGTTKVWQVVND